MTTSNASQVDLEPLADVRTICKKLGGVRRVMQLTQAKSPQVINNWRALNRFAGHTYLILTGALEARGYCAPPELWGIVAPPDTASLSESSPAD